MERVQVGLGGVLAVIDSKGWGGVNTIFYRRQKGRFKRILSRFCTCSGPQKFNLCSSPEQRNVHISSKKSLSF